MKKILAALLLFATPVAAQTFRVNGENVDCLFIGEYYRCFVNGADRTAEFANEGHAWAQVKTGEEVAENRRAISNTWAGVQRNERAIGETNERVATNERDISNNTNRLNTHNTQINALNRVTAGHYTQIQDNIAAIDYNYGLIMNNQGQIQKNIGMINENRSGIAGLAAMSALPFAEGRFSFASGVGNFMGKSSVAFGTQIQIGSYTQVRFTSAINQDAGPIVAGGVGVTIP